MTKGPAADLEASAARIDRTFRAKAKAEIKVADSLVPGASRVSGRGDPTGAVVVVKGEPGPEDLSAREVLAGPDGEAVAKALEALGFDPAAVWVMCSRPKPGIDADARARRVEATVEAVDPRLVIALDAEASDDLAVAFGAGALRPGVPVVLRGREVGAVSGMAASLGDLRAKARVWAELKALARSAMPGDGAPREGASAAAGGSGQRTGRPKAPRDSSCDSGAAGG